MATRRNTRNSKTNSEGDTNMAARKNTPASSDDQFKAFLLELNKLTSKYLGDAAVQAAAKTVAESDDDSEDTDDSGDTSKYTEAQLRKMTIKALRKLAADAGFDPDEVADADKDDIIEALLDDDDDDAEDADSDSEDEEDEEDEDEDEDDEDEDEQEAERAELLELTLAKLRKTARDDYGATAPELKGLDKEGIVDLILGADEEDDADVDVDEDQDDDDAYTEDELNEMDLEELREIAEEWELEVSAKARTKTLVKAILEAQEAEEYDDEDEE